MHDAEKVQLLAPYGSLKFGKLVAKVSGKQPPAPADVALLAPYGALQYGPLMTKVGNGKGVPPPAPGR